MKLYEIDEAIMECVDAETGVIFDSTRFDELKLTREEKIEGVCLAIKNLEAKEKALKEEKNAFEKRRKVAENSINSMKRFISNYLDGQKFETTKVAVSFRKSESLEISDDAVIPEEYLRYKEPEVNKEDLKKAVKAGLVLDGVQLVKKNNIQIK